MITKGPDGRQIDVTIGGESEDSLRIEDAYYLDGYDDEEVSGDVIDWLYDNCYSEMLEEWYADISGMGELNN